MNEITTTGPAPDRPSPEESPSLMDRVTDVFVAPRRAMVATSRRPAWWFPMLLVLVLMGVYTALNVHLIMPEQYERQLADASAEQAAILEQQLEMFSDPPAWLRLVAGLGAAVGAVVIGLMFALACHLFLKLSEAQGRLGQTLGALAWAGLIVYGLKTILGWMALVLWGPEAANLTAAALLGDANPQSIPFLLAATFGDPFMWWTLAVAILGLAHAHRITVGRSGIVVVATFLLFTAITVGFTLLGQMASGA